MKVLFQIVVFLVSLVVISNAVENREMEGMLHTNIFWNLLYADKLKSEHNISPQIILDKHGSQIYPYLKDHVHHKESGIRSHVYSYMNVLLKGEYGLPQKWEDEIKQYVVKALEDESPSIYKNAIKYLHSYDESFFTDDVKKYLFDIFKQDVEIKTRKQRSIMLLMGVSGITEALPYIKKYIATKTVDYEDFKKTNGLIESDYWDALRTLARLGDQESIQESLRWMREIFEKHSKRIPRYFRDLAYIKQPEVVEFIKPYVSSDKVTQPGFLGWDIALCATYVLSEVEPTYPVKFPNAESVKIQDIEKCREWLIRNEEEPKYLNKLKKIQIIKEKPISNRITQQNEFPIEMATRMTNDLSVMEKSRKTSLVFPVIVLLVVVAGLGLFLWKKKK